MPRMLNLISVAIGIAALIGVLVAFIPLLGWLNWVIVPLAVLGLALGVASSGRVGRNLNIVAIVIGVLRLMLGGGIL